MYIMGVVNQEDPNIKDLDKDKINYYKKQARNVTKQLKKWGEPTAAPVRRFRRRLPTSFSYPSGTTFDV